MVVNKKGLKTCGLLLALFIMLGLSLNVCSDSSALRHDIDSVSFGSFLIPCPVLSNGVNSLPSNPSNPSSFGCSYGSGFGIDFDGDASDFSPSGIKPNLSFIRYVYNYYNDGNVSPTEIASIITHNYYSSEQVPGINHFASRLNNYVFPSYNSSFVPFYLNSPNSWSSPSFNFPFGSNGFPSFKNDASGLMSCSSFGNGASCSGLWNTAEYINSEVLPYSYTADGFYIHNTALDDDGVSRSYEFTFSDLFDVDYIQRFSRLEIPLADTDGYFLDSNNLYSGRSIEFKGSFEFKGNMSWNPSLNSNGGSFRLYYSAYPRYNSNNYINSYVDCSVRTTGYSGEGSVGGIVLSYSCPVVLDRDFVIFTPYLVIDGNGNYVWETDADWTWSSAFVVTDNDDTPGSHFSTVRHGGGDEKNVIGSATWIKNSFVDPDIPFFSQLANLFGFGFLNPFAGLFNLFGDSTSCASIPTIAGMIHFEETSVCPWFDSNTRSILTPVLGLSAMMLVFGFAVRWLGSSSGNLFEDSGGIDTENYHFGSRFRRKK